MESRVRIAFDLDGTLIASAPDIQAAANLALAELGLAPVTLQQIESFVGNGLPVLAGLVREARGVREAPDAFLLRISKHYNRLSAESDNLMPGVRAALEALAAAGWRLGLCTNKPIAATRLVLEHLRLDGLFGAVLGGDSLPQRKPDPEPLRQVLAALGTGPALFVGDGEVDAETATRAGVAFALYTKGYRKTPAEALARDRFDDYADLPALARRLARAPEGF